MSLSPVAHVCQSKQHSRHWEVTEATVFQVSRLEEHTANELADIMRSLEVLGRGSVADKEQADDVIQATAQLIESLEEEVTELSTDLSQRVRQLNTANAKRGKILRLKILDQKTSIWPNRETRNRFKALSRTCAGSIAALMVYTRQYLKRGDLICSGLMHCRTAFWTVGGCWENGPDHACGNGQCTEILQSATCWAGSWTISSQQRAAQG